jgi:hypothetical protein
MSLLVGESKEPVRLSGPGRMTVQLDTMALRNIVETEEGARRPGVFYLTLEQVTANQEGITLELYARMGTRQYRIATEGLYGIDSASTRTTEPGFTLSSPLPPMVGQLILEQVQVASTSNNTLELLVSTRLPMPESKVLSIERAALYYEAD